MTERDASPHRTIGFSHSTYKTFRALRKPRPRRAQINSSSIARLSFHSQTHHERAYGQAHSRGGEANTTTETDTGLALVGSYWSASSIVARKGNSVCVRRRGTSKELLIRGEHHSVTGLFIFFNKNFIVAKGLV